MEERQIDAVAVAGGDGTLSPLIDCLVERQLPLLVLPAGTANDFARSLCMPGTPEDLAALLTDGRLSAVDVGYANDRPFLNAASIGMTNTISRLQTKDRKSRWGVLSYAISAVEAALKPRSFVAQIEGDHADECDASSLSATGVSMAGNASAPRCNAERSRFYAVVPRSAFGLAAMLPFLRFGRADLAPETPRGEGTEISIATRPKRRVFADGEEPTERQCASVSCPKR